jgi:hypothetical protein
MKEGNLDIFHIIDNVIMGMYGITEEEYDYIAAHMSEEELNFLCDVILSETHISYSDIRYLVQIKTKYLTQMKNTLDDLV